jgi:hypothetical protein
MKRKLPTVFLFIFTAFAASGLSVDIQGGLFYFNPRVGGERIFHEDNITAHVGISGNPKGNLLAGAEYSRDALFVNRAAGWLGYKWGDLTFRGGLFLGLINTQQLPINPGFSFSLGYQSSLFYVNGGGNFTFRMNLNEPGDYTQSMGFAEAGIWLGSARIVRIMVTGSLAQEKIILDSSTMETEDRYRGEVAMGYRNPHWPLGFRFGLIYQYFNWNLNDTNSSNYSARSPCFGLDVSLSMTPAWKAAASFEMPFYSTVNQNLKREASTNLTMFEASLRLTWTSGK